MDRRPRVVVSHWIHPEAREALDAFCDSVVPTDRVVWRGEELIARVRDADGLIACMADHVDAAFLDRCPRLKIVAATLKGYDNFDVRACRERDIWLTIVPEAIIDPTAELAVGLIIGLLRRINEADRVIRDRPYEGWRPDFYAKTLRGSDVGILGMGALGQTIAAMLGGFGPRIRYADPQPLTPEVALALAAERRSLDALVGESEVLVVALPLTPETRRLLDRDLIARMPRGAILVNVGRGSTVDEIAVAEALEAGRLDGYGADVFAAEDWAAADRPSGIPPTLLAHPRTLFTPHLGSAVDAVRRRMSLVAVEQVRQALSGRVPEHAVN
jgi:phosphonate dehydrogenase